MKMFQKDTQRENKVAFMTKFVLVLKHCKEHFYKIVSFMSKVSSFNLHLGENKCVKNVVYVKRHHQTVIENQYTQLQPKLYFFSFTTN